MRDKTDTQSIFVSYERKFIAQQKGETIMHNQSRSFIAILAIVFALVLFTAAQAQESPFNIENVPNVVGVGVAAIPDYMGSDNYTVGAAPFLKYTYPNSQWYLRLLVADVQINVINHPIFRLGPAVNYRFGRSDNVDDKVVKHMEEIDGTIEAGAFAGIELVDKDNPRQRFLAQVEWLSDVGNVYNGYNVSVTASFWAPVHKMVDVTIGGGCTYASDNYMNTYFGVSQKDSERTGLPGFKASAGFRDVRINPGAVVHLSPDWHVAAGIQYRRLLDDAESSPVVDDRGSANQWIMGLGVAYSWK
jgi:MipA family protein